MSILFKFLFEGLSKLLSHELTVYRSYKTTLPAEYVEDKKAPTERKKPRKKCLFSSE